MSIQPLLRVRLGASYGAKSVLHDIDFDLHRGEVLGLVGTSGAGKSTLVLSLLGLLPWRGGRVTGQIVLDGQDLLQLSESRLRDANQAIALARRAVALSRGGDIRALDALAAALAEAGNFPAATRAAEQASALALARRDKALCDAIDGRLRLYRQGVPYHAAPPDREP